MTQAADTITTYTCGHCGNRVRMYIRAEYRWSEPDLDEIAAHGLSYDEIEVDIVTWRLLQCPACSKPVLEEISMNSLRISPHDGEPIAERRILYPTASGRLQGLPSPIKKEYDATLKVRHISPPACAVLAGRTLEVLCHLEGAVGKTLVQQLNSLVQAGKIPNILGEMAQQLRQIRNLGAHSASDEVTNDDVNIIIDFLEAILEYRYVAPARIAAVQTRLSKTP